MKLNLISIIHEELNSCCEAVYLYGSQVNSSDISKDIDLAIVCRVEQKVEVLEKLNKLQNSIHQLIHPIFITKSDIERNPGFKKIVTDGCKFI